MSSENFFLNLQLWYHIYKLQIAVCIHFKTGDFFSLGILYVAERAKLYIYHFLYNRNFRVQNTLVKDHIPQIPLQLGGTMWLSFSQQDVGDNRK